ncbi:oleate hydratase [Bifidobacterium tissieri]|uniref:Oleate hydratase n=1 Tax=Bifidobacterium tissieri TaxID=1630162 RepID=A0A5M9ZRE6_9BIFI|nr:oleate hydratase [Bifidobacterium tissieri]KAA8830078.1 oleate hydratase [Bifidobacterium tissieri]
MYYSSGNYEAFARPKKPEGVEGKSAYIIGTGLAALSAACYLVRDAQMPGGNIHILEKDAVPGGACDGLEIPGLGYVMRGGREMDNHFEVMWDLFRSIPSIETEGVSVLDEYYWLNKEDPNYSLCRATKELGKDAGTQGKFGLSDKAAQEIMKLFFTPDEDLYDKPITDFFDDEVLDSNFWMYWRTMFAFENWHSALEMKLYIKRYIHHIGGLPDFSALRFTRYNQYESMILPMVKYLEAHGVQFHYNTKVENVEFAIGGGDGPKRERTGVGQDTIQKIQATSGMFKRNPYSTPTKKIAVRIDVNEDGSEQSIDLTKNDLVFITNGGCVENSTMGSQHSPAAWNPEIKPGGGWDMWRRIAAQDASFGHPDTFCSDPQATKWMSATVTTLDGEIPPYIKRICKRDPFSGHVVTGGIVTVTDSNWLMSWTLNRQQQFRDQPKDQLCVWVYGLFPDKPGNYVKKPMTECTGEEICAEWLYHMGVPAEKIDALAKNHANTVPVMMPYITAFFMPRAAGDRPDVVPDGAVNFAFLGQFAETPRDTIFTTEYSMRTGMEAVYTLLDVDRGVPEVWGSVYDVRNLLNSTVKLRDGQPVTTMKLNFVERAVLGKVLKKLNGTDIGKLLSEYGVV